MLYNLHIFVNSVSSTFIILLFTPFSDHLSSNPIILQMKQEFCLYFHLQIWLKVLPAERIFLSSIRNRHRSLSYMCFPLLLFSSSSLSLLHLCLLHACLSFWDISSGSHGRDEDSLMTPNIEENVWKTK